MVVETSLEQELADRLYQGPSGEEGNLYVYLFDRPMELYPGNSVVVFAKYKLWEKLSRVNADI